MRIDYNKHIRGGIDMNEQEIRKEALAMAIKTIRDEKEISSLLERARIFSQYIETGEIGGNLPDLPAWIPVPNEPIEVLPLR